jgi:hypothetical protein
MVDSLPGALQRAVHRGRRGVQDLRDLRGGELQHLTQDQHGALSTGQVLQCGDEGQLHALPSQVARRGIGVARFALLHLFGPGFEPYRSGHGLTEVVGAPQRRSVVNGEHPPGRRAISRRQAFVVMR